MKLPVRDTIDKSVTKDDCCEADNERRERHLQDCLEDDDVAEVLKRLHQHRTPGQG